MNIVPVLMSRFTQMTFQLLEIYKVLEDGGVSS